MIKLVISDNEGTTTVVPLVRDEITIGRQEGNTIRLTDRNVSRRHARLVAREGTYVVEDLSSYNGLLLNGKPIEGQQVLRTGDELSIGDYVIRVHADTLSAVPMRPGTSLPPPPSTPARVVMLNGPSPGAEFSLAENDRPIMLGRSEHLDVPINHRSVSREHAQIVREREQYVVYDMESANGLIVNGSKVQRQALVPGDIIELGQIVFRFVGAGERYIFNPDDAVRYARLPAVRNKENARLAAVLLGSAIVIAAVVLFTSGNEPDYGPEAYGMTDESMAEAGAPRSEEEFQTDYSRALASCQEALNTQRYAEAAAHAQRALRERPGDTDASACRSEAQRLVEDEQIFFRGKASLLSNDAEAAYRAFTDLSENSPFLSRPEVKQVVDMVAGERLAAAGVMMSSDPEAAIIQAEAVIAMPALSGAHREAAVALVEAARNSAKAASENAGRTAATGSAEVAAPVAQAPGSKPAPKPAPRPPATPRAPRERPAAPGAENAAPAGQARSIVDAEPAPDPAKAGPSPFEQAKACLARGDSACAVDALAGKANSEREMALLVETYRAMGNTQATRKYMAVYVEQFPSARRAGSYREQLARSDQ